MSQQTYCYVERNDRGVLKSCGHHHKTILEASSCPSDGWVMVVKDGVVRPLTKEKKAAGIRNPYVHECVEQIHIPCSACEWAERNVPERN
jgi:hypothetical protein